MNEAHADRLQLRDRVVPRLHHAQQPAVAFARPAPSTNVADQWRRREDRGASRMLSDRHPGWSRPTRFHASPAAAWQTGRSEVTARTETYASDASTYAVLWKYNIHSLSHQSSASGCVIECWICNREVGSSNLGQGYFASRSTQSSIPPGSG